MTVLADEIGTHTATLKTELAKARGYITALPSILPGVDWSDHWSCRKVGYAAIMLTDTGCFATKTTTGRATPPTS